MKINGTLLVLSVFHPNVWGSSAFIVQAPNTRANALKPYFSYLEELGEGVASVGALNQVSLQGIRMATVNECRTIHRPRHRSLYNKTVVFLDQFSKDSSLQI